jgi:hypothetical protein
MKTRARKLLMPGVMMMAVLLTTGLWASGYLLSGEILDWTRPSVVIDIASVRGHIAFLGATYRPTAHVQLGIHLYSLGRRISVEQMVPGSRLRPGGFDLGSYQIPLFSVCYLILPDWLLVLAATTGLVWSIRRVFRNRLIDPQSRPCAKCGYDLRASHSRCPECGTTIQMGPSN